MKKNTFGVAAILVRWKPRTVNYAVVHFSGTSRGVPHFNVSDRRYTEQSDAIKKAQKLNARRKA